MSYWDSSALVKLYVREFDSAEFRELAVKASRLATGSLTRHEARTLIRRREAEGVLPSGEAAALYDELTADIAAADIVIQPDGGYEAARGGGADGIHGAAIVRVSCPSQRRLITKLITSASVHACSLKHVHL
jgi:hypothetical protein